MRILIANRGEIARRIMRTAHRMGHETIAVFAEPDSDSPFVGEATIAVPLGPASLADSYLSVDRLLEVAQRNGADALHPGYGFLSERADFAASVVDAGMIWIGPHPSAIAQMGSKIEARRIADAVGVAVIPGFDASQDPARLSRAADEIGYPVLVKAAAGGGGKGIRIVDDPGSFEEQLRSARAEAESAFGDDAVIVERYIRRPRHVEVQVLADRHGSVVHLGTRECSVQRRFQKLLEEAPAPNLDPSTTGEMTASAVALAESIGYDSAGTVEFVVDDESGDHFFLEMNTRLQVEHPVTEEVTGVDLVELMIDSACGARLPMKQADVTLAGHALEVRINAEDVTKGFMPATGSISHLRVPPGVRWDSAVELGSVIGPHYDSMIAKLIVHGSDRADAITRMRNALDEVLVGGLPTTAGFHRWLVDQEPFVAGRITTRFLDETPPPPESSPDPGALERAALTWVLAERPPGLASSPWAAIGPFRLTPHEPVRRVFLRDEEGEIQEVAVNDDASAAGSAVADPASRSVAVNDAGRTRTFTVLTRSDAWAPAGDVGHGHAGAVVAPFPAVVSAVRVSPGDVVAGGDEVVVLEAMKMLHSLVARGPGRVQEVRVAPGDQVDTNELLITFAGEEASEQ